MPAPEILDPVIAAANERRASAAAKRAAKLEAAAPETARRIALDAAALEEALAEHGEIGVGVGTCDTGLGLVVVRRPREAEAAHFRARLSKLAPRDDAGLTDASAVLVRACLLHPPSADYHAICAAKPFLAARVCDLVLRLAGATGE